MIQFQFYKNHIRGTAQYQKITLARGFLCNVKPSLLTVLTNNSGCTGRPVYLSTKSLKHIHDRHVYDKGNFSEFIVILQNLTRIIKFPDEVRMDARSKRGDFMFVKNVAAQPYFVSIQISPVGEMDILSSSATGESYLKNFTLLWSWGSANSP